MVLLPDGERALLERLARGRVIGELAGAEGVALPRDKADLHACIEQRNLRTVYQPILELRSGRVFGYEALSRGPEASAIESPMQLFGLARRCDLSGDVERLAAALAL